MKMNRKPEFVWTEVKKESGFWLWHAFHRNADNWGSEKAATLMTRLED